MTVIRDVTDGSLTITLDGVGFRSRYLAAVLVEPGPGHVVRERIVADMEQRYRETWQQKPAGFTPVDNLQLVARAFQHPMDPGAPAVPSRATTTPGGYAILDLWAHAPWPDAMPTWQIDRGFEDAILAKNLRIYQPFKISLKLPMI